MSFSPVRNIPKIVIRDANTHFIKFTLSDSCLSVANAIRRVSIAEVPTIAIDLVEVIENSSVLCDEFIAHRLGLIPLTSDSASDYLLPSEYEGDDEMKTDVYLNLAVRCSSDRTLDVTTNHFLCQNTKIKPVNYKSKESISDERGAPGVLIVKLRKNQELIVKCIARKGIGKDHAKWSPVATAVYKCEPEFRLSEEANNLTDREKNELVNSCPIPILRLNQQTNALEIQKNDSYAYDDECIKKV